MGNTIQPLDPELIYRIAAAEVIDSVGAVVRELVDNALDAAATRISISLWPDLGKVEVADNGVGLTWANLQQAALPHTTSKISTFEHLHALQTLGFRGEALHSLTQLGRLEISSRVTTSPTGWHVQYDSKGAVAQAQEIAMAAGTTVTVTHLFETWPSRQQDFTPANPWLAGIQATIGDYALCHPHVTWQTYLDRRSWFSLAPGQTAKDVGLQLIRKLTPDDLRYAIFPIEIASTNLDGSPRVSKATLEGLIGLPDRYHRHRPDWVRVAVNGRRVCVNAQPSSESWGALEQTILNAFRQILPRHRHPFCWIHLKVSPDGVDWNRTASKSHIYLHQLDAWKHHITQSIHQLLNLPTQQEPSGAQTRQLFKSAEAKGRYALASPLNLSSSLPLPDRESGLSEASVGMVLGSLKAIAQLHQTYIVAEHSAGLWLIEQHIAHERVLYEQLCQDWQLTALDTPLTLRNLSEIQVQNLNHLGLSTQPFGPDLWIVRTAPRCLAQRSDCLQAIYELSQCTDAQPALVATACRSAIRNGQTLSLSEMQTLLDQWQTTQNPRTCPHGRPIYLRMDEQSLSKFFRRYWVVGKSHGI
jgi:DNA mismatch repair protein MutL